MIFKFTKKSSKPLLEHLCVQNAPRLLCPQKGNNKRQKGILSYILGFNFDSNFSKPLSMSSSCSI